MNEQMPQDKESISVLIVDDDKNEYLLISDTLSQIETNTYRVDWEKNPQTGREIILQRRHDVVLLDYKLGIVTGLEILQSMQGKRTPPNNPDHRLW